MTALSPNCLLAGETLAELVRRNCAIGFDLRFCRTIAHTPEDGETTPCDPTYAEFATLYARTDLGEAIAIHDVDLSSAGADEVAAISRALFVAIVNARRYPPDAAQRHEAEQEALIEPDRTRMIVAAMIR